MKCIDAPESTVIYLSSWWIPVQERAPVTVFVLKNVSLISWYVPRILLNMCAVSMLQFIILLHNI